MFGLENKVSQVGLSEVRDGAESGIEVVQMIL